MMDFFNLQAFMLPLQPSRYVVVGSRLSAPSGFVLDNIEVGCAELNRGGEVARPNCFLILLFKVICAICKRLFVVSHSSKVTYVKWNATAEME
jgi:hypothetical protein